MELTVRVVGAKAFQGNIEGKNFNHTKVRIELPMATSDTSMGNDVMDWVECGDASVLAKWRSEGVQIPGMFVVDMATVMKRGAPAQEIHSIKPMAVKAVASAQKVG